MERTLTVLNDLVARGIIERYAIGGAVAAIYWVEPFDTIDLDVFVLLPPDAPPLDPLRDIHAELRARGYEFDEEFLVVEGVPVQFLPAEDQHGLRKEALSKAAPIEYAGSSGPVPSWVITPEYLVALALDVHRSKDYERVFRLLSETKTDGSLIRELVSRFALQASWEQFVRRYPEFS